MKLPSIPLVILDTETTGLLPRVNRIIEFASVRVENGDIIDEYEQLFSIPDEIPAHVRVLTRIVDDDLRGRKITKKHVAADINAIKYYLNNIIFHDDNIKKFMYNLSNFFPSISNYN